MNLELMPRTRTHDVSGFGVFAHGDAGEAHVMAHHMLAEGRHELGHRLLGAWLEGHSGNGSDWTHLQWHMAVFEIAVGRWKAALARFERQILPVAERTDDALTDAPAILWRLHLASPGPVELAWAPVRERALLRLARPSSHYVELHCLLALAGANDVEGLERWLEGRTVPAGTRDRLLTQMGVGLRALAARDFELATVVLNAASPNVSALGGSHAQNQLFTSIAKYSWIQAQSPIQAAA